MDSAAHLQAVFAIFAVVGLLLYFVPAVIAFGRDARHAIGIAILNLFFGWTAIGWVGALIWSLSDSPAEAVLRVELRACPFCAEDIKREALICKHCGRNMP